MFGDNLSFHRQVSSNMDFLDPLKWNRHVVPKRRDGITTLCCVTFQKSVDFVNIETEAWSHAWWALIWRMKGCKLNNLRLKLTTFITRYKAQDIVFRLFYIHPVIIGCSRKCFWIANGAFCSDRTLSYMWKRLWNSKKSMLKIQEYAGLKKAEKEVLYPAILWQWCNMGNIYDMIFN